MAAAFWQCGPSSTSESEHPRCSLVTMPLPLRIYINVSRAINACVFSPLFFFLSLPCGSPFGSPLGFSTLFYFSLCLVDAFSGVHLAAQAFMYIPQRPAPPRQHPKIKVFYTHKTDVLVVLAQHLHPRPFDSWIICNTFACRSSNIISIL